MRQRCARRGVSRSWRLTSRVIPSQIFFLCSIGSGEEGKRRRRPWWGGPQRSRISHREMERSVLAGAGAAAEDMDAADEKGTPLSPFVPCFPFWIFADEIGRAHV